MIIGFAGELESGKDTAADALVTHYGFVKFSMATALRRECAEALASRHCPPEAPEDICEILRKGLAVDVYAKPTTPDARRLLQWHGVDYRRTQNPNYWVDQLEPLLSHVLDGVIADIRFSNEIDLVRRHGGYVCKVERPGYSGRRPAAASGHSSERLCSYYADWDAVLTNNGTLAAFERTVLGVVSTWYDLETHDPTDNAGCRPTYHT